MVEWLYDGVSKSFRTESNKHSLRSNTKGYGGKTYWTDSQNSDITAPSGRELYHLQFSLQAASPETLGYTLVIRCTAPSAKPIITRIKM
jgi:hypothetical protein